MADLVIFIKRYCLACHFFNSIDVVNTSIEVVAVVSTMHINSRHERPEKHFTDGDVELAVAGSQGVVDVGVGVPHVMGCGNPVDITLREVGILHIDSAHLASRGLETLLVASLHILEHPLAARAL